jgi:hypothetical protein
MKTRQILKNSIFLFATLILIASCKKEEQCKTSRQGILKLTNGSLNTVQRVMIDGVNYGTIDPGESKESSLAAGSHEFQQVGISGGTGCSAAKVIIVECETEGYQCNN